MIYSDILSLLPDSVFNLNEESNNAKIFSVFRSAIESVDTVFGDLMLVREIESQGGAVLDLIGEIVRENRAGRNDDAFRIFLMSALQKLLCTGSIESLQNVFSSIAGEYFIGVWDLTPGQMDNLYNDVSVYTSGDAYLDGSCFLSGQRPEAEVSPFEHHLNGAFFLNGGFFLSGTVFQPGFFEVRVKAGLSAEIKTQIESIINIIKPGGVGYRLSESEE